MRTVRRLLYRDIIGAVIFVAVAFLALLFFFDFINALEDIGKKGFRIQTAVVASLLKMPGNLYELMPIAVLIGTIFSLARMAQTSEYTILRTSGLGPGRALSLLATLGLGFALVTVITGDVITPLTARLSVAMKAEQSGGMQLGRTGAWLRDQRDTTDGLRNVSANVTRVGGQGQLEGIRLYEFDAAGNLRTRVSAVRGAIKEQSWLLDEVTVTQWSATPIGASAASNLATTPAVREAQHASLSWPTTLDPDVVTAAIFPASSMSTLELWRYASHLSDREQSAQRYVIQFWKKAFYPLACLVMMALALPFAYLSARASGISLKVFGGILMGISFWLMNSLAEHLGVLSDWTPWLVAAAPSILFTLIAMGAFTWLVRFR